MRVCVCMCVYLHAIVYVSACIKRLERYTPSTMSFIFTMVRTIHAKKETENVSACIDLDTTLFYHVIHFYNGTHNTCKERDGETDKVGKTAGAEKQHSLLKAKLSEIKLGHQMHR